MKRSLIITLALIAAIAAPLCASTGWARGLGVLGLGGGAAVSGPAYALYDTFTEASTVALTSHSPEIGGAWVAQTSVYNVDAGGWAVGSVSSATTIAYNNATTADDITATITASTGSTSSSSIAGVYLRVSTDGKGYHALIAGDAKFYIIERSANGVFNGVLAGPYTITGFSSSTVYTIEFSAVGTSLSATLSAGGTQIQTLTATDSTLASGYVGIMGQGTYAKIYDISAN